MASTMQIPPTFKYFFPHKANPSLIPPTWRFNLAYVATIWMNLQSLPINFSLRQKKQRICRHLRNWQELRQILAMELASASNDGGIQVLLAMELASPSNDGGIQVLLAMELASPSNDGGIQVLLATEPASPSNDGGIRVRFAQGSLR